MVRYYSTMAESFFDSLEEAVKAERELLTEKEEAFKKKFKSAENAKRIKEFCETFKEIWLRMLDWRFGQLALEDDEMLEMLKEVITAYDKYIET